MRRCLLGPATVLLAAALLTSPITPAHANDGGDDAAAAVVLGGFHLGDAIEAAIDEQTGGFAFGLPVGGLNLGWDSRRLHAGDRAGLGRGWSFGVGHLETAGGVRVFPASGGVYAANGSVPSGLDGYEAGDLRFEAVGSVELAARADASAAAAHYAYTLRELGGMTTYFSADGDPIASIDATGRRIDRVFSGEVPHRLERVVDADGVVTSLDWLADRVEVRPGANLPGDADRASWTILLGGDGVRGTIDPLGIRTSVAVDDRDLVRRVETASGTATEVTWVSSSDGAPHVDRVRTVGADGRELSVRNWRVEGEALGATGWPAFADARGMPGAAGSELEYTTVIDDGRSRVSSTYNDLHSLIRRVMTASTGSGELVLQEQAFAYPSTDEQGRRVATPTSSLAVWGKPTAVSVTFRDAEGGARVERERSVFDEFGRQTSRTSADGTITQIEYDREVPETLGVPIGLPLVERTIAPDGLVGETRFELNTERTAVVAAERSTGRDQTSLVPAARLEYTLEDDGFVSETRAYPAEGQVGGEPRVTRHARAVDLAAGVVTETELVAVGTPDEVGQTRTVSLVHGGVTEQVDTAGNATRATYDQLGRVITSTDASGRVSTTTYETRQRDGRDATTLTRPDGVAVTEQRDELGRVTAITDNIERGEARAGFVRIAETREYPAPGVVRTTDAWGATTTTERDAFGRVVRTVAPNGLVHVTEHDPVTGATTDGLTPTGDLADAEATSTRAVDVDGRVVRVTGVREDGVDVPERTTEYDGLGREVRALDGTAYRYDAANRRVAEQRDGVVTETAYWADGSRRSLSTTDVDRIGARTEFYWDGDTLLNDAHSADAEPTVLASYLVGVDRHARTVGPAGVDGRTEYFGTDRHGNTTELTDESGAVGQRYEYADYGAVTAIGASSALSAGQPAATGRAAERAHRNPIQYAGEYADPSGTLHLAARDYDTVTMRFQSMDTERLRSRYAFGDLNPVMNVDPTGHDALRDTVVNGFLIGLGVVAAFVTAATMVTPVGPAAIAASVGAWGALVGDATSIGIATALLVDDSFDFIDDDDRRALSISGTVIGGVSALAGPAFNYLAKKLSAVDPVVLVPDAPQVPPTALSLTHVAKNHVNPFLFPDGSPMPPEQLVPLFGERIIAVLKTIDSDAPFLLGGAGIDAGGLARSQLDVIAKFAKEFIAAAKTPALAAETLKKNTAAFAQAVIRAKGLPQQLGSTGGDAWTQQWWANLNRISADQKDAVTTVIGQKSGPVKTDLGTDTLPAPDSNRIGLSDRVIGTDY